MQLKQKVLKIIRHIIFIMVCIIFSLGFSLLIQGPYFYNLTSKQSFDNLFDQVLNESIQKEEFYEICNSANISCSSFYEIISGICNRSDEIKTYYNELIANISKYFNVSESDALAFVCSNNQELCQNITKVKEVSIEYENLCKEMKKYSNELEQKKEEIYNKNFFMSYSLSDINSKLKNSFFEGLGILVFGLVLMYFLSRSFYKAAKSSASIILIIGLSWIILGYLGESFLIKGNILPKEMPKSFIYFIKEIFSFEILSGIYVTIFSTSFLIFVILSKGFFVKNKSEKIGKS